ncbi:MAG: hypothetical protein ACC669_04370 [bacterium]
MIKVKTFTTPLKIFHTHQELDELDAQVNRFLEDGGIGQVVSVSDTTTTGENGETVGLIRVVTYIE